MKQYILTVWGGDAWQEMFEDIANSSWVDLTDFQQNLYRSVRMMDKPLSQVRKGPVCRLYENLPAARRARTKALNVGLEARIEELDHIRTHGEQIT